MKVLFIHAHFDDYEFCTAGTFEVWRRKIGKDFQAKVIVCTDGKAGHHQLSREDTGRVRLEEQLQSAALGNYKFEQLKLPNGKSPREACLQVDVPLLAALWKAIRDFEPDYLFSPPLPNDTLAGIHVDHVAVAEAVRKVAYMINVPHAFTPEYPSEDSASKPCKVPVILNAYDGYMFGENAFDLAIDVSEAFDLMAEMSWCLFTNPFRANKKKSASQPQGKTLSQMQRHIDMERALFQEKAILRAREALVSRSGQVGSAQACPRAR